MRTRLPLVLFAVAATLLLLRAAEVHAQRRWDTSYVVLKAPDSATQRWQRDDRRRVPDGHDGLRMPAGMRVIATTHWHVPEYHDEQRFVDGGQFGPYAYLYASPWLNGFSRMSHFVEHGTWGVLVALLHVDPPSGGGALPASYTNLSLVAGGNCIWLANSTGTENGWRAFVSAEHASRGCMRTGGRQALSVYRMSDPAFGFDDFPAVARFSHATSGQPLIGVKCLEGWCEIGPAGLTPEDEHPGFGTREDRIKGWSDNQILGEANAAGMVLPSTVRASIIPAPNVNRYSEAHFHTTLPSTNHSGGWTQVARIVLTADPPAGSKYHRWGLRAGTNRVALRRASGVWQARVTPPASGGTLTHYIWENVYREQHFDATIPATARWRVAFFDDPIWVPCGQACCSVDGGT